MNKQKRRHIKLHAIFECPHCKTKKDKLDDKIKNEIIFANLNPKEAENMVIKTGQMNVPITEIKFKNSNSEYIIGFEVQRFLQILGIV